MLYSVSVKVASSSQVNLGIPEYRSTELTCQGSDSTKTPLAKVEVWGFRNISKEYKDMKIVKHRREPVGSSSEY